MANKKKLALLGCSALLLSGIYFGSSKGKINEKHTIVDQDCEATIDELSNYIDSLFGVIFEYEVLLDIHPYFEPYSCETKIESLQEEIMDLGAKLDSCIIVND